MTTAAVFAAIDGLVGIYLIAHGLLREQRDKAGVIVVGWLLCACSVSLAVISVTR